MVQRKKMRISASKSAHSVLALKRKVVETLVLDILYPKQFQSVSTQYGISNESKARAQYKKLRNCRVIQVGTIVKKKQEWLCANPDCIVVCDFCLTKVVVFKCPY